MRRVKRFLFLLIVVTLPLEGSDISEPFFTINSELPTPNFPTLVKGTLVQLQSLDGEKVNLKVFQRKGSPAGGWTESHDRTVSKERWNALPKQSRNVRILGSGPTATLQVERREGWFPLFQKNGTPLYCQPKATDKTVEDVEAILDHASNHTNYLVDITVVEHGGSRQLLIDNRPESPSEAEVRRKYRELMGDFNWLQKQRFWGSGLKTKEQLSEAKLKFIEDLKRRSRREMWDDSRANDFLVALTLFGEFRGEADRLEAHLFWATEVMKNRTQSPEFRNRLTIDTAVKNDSGNWIYKKYDWLSGTEAGAAMSKWQFSAWNVTIDNDNLRTILNPSRENGATQAFGEIAKFLAHYRAGSYDIDGKDPKPTYYVSPKSNPSSLPFSEAIKTLPPIKKTLLVNPDAFQGGR